MSFRVENTVLTNGITFASELQPDNTYTVTGKVSWAPSLINDGQMLYCDVMHATSQGDGPQTVSLKLTVNSK